MKVNNELFNTLHKLEEQLLNDYASFFEVQGKSKQLSFKNISMCGYLKFYQEKNDHYRNGYKYNTNYEEKHNYYIKISGVWESSFQYGITYKIIEF